MDAWSENLKVSTEGLVYTHFCSFDLINRRAAAATDARTPYIQASSHVATAFQA
jgi:hypothetical protein